MLIVVADQHIGSGASLGDRLSDQQSSWTRVCTAAAELGATILHAGDVFNARKASPSEMRAFQAGLDILREGNCEMIVALGNHDRADMDSPTSVEVASAGYDVQVCREPQVFRTADGAVGFLPWMPPRMSAKQTAEALMIVAEGLAEQGARVLIAHWALAGGSLPNGLPLLELAEPLLDPYALHAQLDLVLAGHIHKRQEIVAGVHHIGALSRTSFGEAACDTGAWQIAERGIDRGDAPPAFELEASWFEVPDRAFLSIEVDVRGLHDLGAAGVLEILGEQDIEGSVIRVAWHQTADQVVDQAPILDYLQTEGAHHVDRLTPIVERVQSTRSEGVDENLEPAQAFDTWLGAQTDTAAPDTIERVRETAHDWIGGAA